MQSGGAQASPAALATSSSHHPDRLRYTVQGTEAPQGSSGRGGARPRAAPHPAAPRPAARGWGHSCDGASFSGSASPPRGPPCRPKRHCHLHPSFPSPPPDLLELPPASCPGAGEVLEAREGAVRRAGTSLDAASGPRQ